MKIHWISESKRWERDGMKEKTPDTNLIGPTEREREREKQQT
jgi:hypothetical protein